MPEDHDPLVSVIIPTFNRSAYLEQAIDSVLDQTFQDFEVVVVDDGSTDDTARVVSQIADPRIRYVSQENAGRSAARNRGLALSSGEFIAFLDDDDLYLRNKLRQQVAFLNDHPPVDLVASDSQVIDENGQVQDVWRRWERQPDLTLESCVITCPLSTCSVLVRRAAVESLDHWFDTEMDLAEDTDLFLRLLASGCEARWLREILSSRRLYSTGSQMPGIAYAHAFEKLLDKLFARPDLPKDVRADRQRIYAEHYVTGACHAYLALNVPLAQAALTRGLELQPQWAEGSTPAVVLRIADFARSRWVSRPRAYIDRVFAHLPCSYAFLKRHRRTALGALHAGFVFQQRLASRASLVEHWVLAILYDHTLISNPGFWSTGVRTLLMARHCT